MKFTDWLETATSHLAQNMPPERTSWQCDARQADLFGVSRTPIEQNAPALQPDFVKFCRLIACHRDERKWHLLYKALWRMTKGEPYLLELATDPLVRQLRDMEHQIRRDAHKAKAFVRFRRVTEDGAEHYVAWHQPDHFILRLVAPFFQRRFNVMRWSILTPDESVLWDGDRLVFAAGYPKPLDTENDAFEDLWRVYYRSTFNPARIKIKMMKKEMPVRYWHTMPETALIPGMLKDAQNRVSGMLAATDGFEESAEHFLPAEKTYASLRDAASRCRGGPLHCNATQTVFGEGPAPASLMLVGEQPGDMEDRAGRPFVGPAGKVFDDLLEATGMNRGDLYITNAVKHFKYKTTYGRRAHRSPDAREINACKPWLMEEINLVQPKLIITLGVTAARSLIHHGFTLKNAEGRNYAYAGIPVLPTWHPSAVLRAPDEGMKTKIKSHIAGSFVKALHCLTQAEFVSDFEAK